MNILVTGATGLIGQALLQALTHNHQLIVVGRSRDKLQTVFGDQHTIHTWDEIEGQGTEILQTCDVVINLAGENIAAKRWSNAQKEEIIVSRVKATSLIATICAQLGAKAPRILNASAIGIYGLQKTIAKQNEVIYSEDTVLSDNPDDFIARVGTAWEQALLPAENAGIKTVKLRFAVVLAKQGGALTKMLPAFKLGLGAILGTGKQPFPWVALEDVLSAIQFILANPEITWHNNQFIFL